jgi:transcriptional regulator with XRE-family HTH domain
MKSIYSNDYKKLIEWLISKRILLGITQAQLAQTLGKHQSFVSKYENAERRLDVIEFIDICSVVNADPNEIITILKK